jgi:hypothetical protein
MQSDINSHLHTIAKPNFFIFLVHCKNIDLCTSPQPSNNAKSNLARSQSGLGSNIVDASVHKS